MYIHIRQICMYDKFIYAFENGCLSIHVHMYCTFTLAYTILAATLRTNEIKSNQQPRNSLSVIEIRSYPILNILVYV